VIPVKVLVVGAGEAGKSTLISALCPHAMNLAVNGRTVAMDHATLTLDRFRVSLIGVPGQHRFAVVREALATGACAAVWVHRAPSDPDSQTVKLIAGLVARGMPYVVYVNHTTTQPGHDGWRQPDEFPPPATIIAGNLLHPEQSLLLLKEEIERIILLHQRKEPDDYADRL